MLKAIRKLLANKSTTCAEAGRKGYQARKDKEQSQYVDTAAKLAISMGRQDLADKLKGIRDGMATD